MIELINGQIRSIFVTQLVVNAQGEPLMLRTIEDVYYNWANIIAVKNVSTPQEKAKFN